jgi:3-methyladenine DNA glycosylase/8-oxoguanine DNA glycosylase
MNPEAKSRTLVKYIQSLPSFRFEEGEDETCGHMGAIITDAVLQAGVKYETVVRPRVQRLIQRHPEAATTSAFLTLLSETGPHTLLQFRGKKPERVRAVAAFFQAEGVDTDSDLLDWLENPDNCGRLRSISGVGDKTVDYFKLLVGMSTVAIDRHLRRFLDEANVEAGEYAEAQAVIARAADMLGVSSSCLDHSIWTYMSEKAKRCAADRR